MLVPAVESLPALLFALPDTKPRASLVRGFFFRLLSPELDGAWLLGVCWLNRQSCDGQGLFLPATICPRLGPVRQPVAWRRMSSRHAISPA
jgi:hypothetical protein